MREAFKRVIAAIIRWVWYSTLRMNARPTDKLFGPDDALDLRKSAKSIRIAPSRMGIPLASFWSFRWQGDQIYVGGRNYLGDFKLSFHSSGKWYSSLGSDQKRLAPGVLHNGQWRHAMQLAFLVGENTVPPQPEKPFETSDPGYMIECPPGHCVVAQLLIGTDGTTLDTALPKGFDEYRRLLPMKLRDDRCAVVLGEALPMPLHSERAIAEAYAQRDRLTGKARGGIEIFSVAIHDGQINVINVIPLAPAALE